MKRKELFDLYNEINNEVDNSLKGKYILTLIAINKYGEKIKTNCAISITHKELDFTYNGKCHTIAYKETIYGNYFILNKERYYFKIWDNYEDKWLIDCNCF